MPPPHRDSGETVSTLPLWLVIVDGAVLAILLLAAAVAVGGGFRLMIGVIRLSVTSAIPLIGIATLLAAARHYLRAQPTLLTRCRAGIRAVWSAEGVAEVLPCFLATRAAILVVGMLAVFTIGFPAGAPPFKIADSELLNLPARWDGGWYLEIAITGYDWNARRPQGQQNIAFFPALPLLTRVGGRALGGSTPAFAAAGVLVSHVAFLLALLYLFRLARTLGASAIGAQQAVLLLSTFPFSLFHGAIYTESLFLVGSLGAIRNLIAGRYIAAAAWGLLVGLTRPNGFLLSVTLAAVFLTHRSWRRELSADGFRPGILLALAAPTIGAAIFSAFVYHLSGNPFQWASQHAAWGRVFTGVRPFAGAAEFAANRGLEAYMATAPVEAMNVTAAVCSLLLILPVWRMLGIAFAVFICVNLLPPLFFGGVLSIGRLTATLFPLFIWSGARLRPPAALGVAIGFMALQALSAVLFYTWRPMF
jgi:mannosyltransferase PIG-V